MRGTEGMKTITRFSTEDMLQELGAFDPIIFKYYYGRKPEEVYRLIRENNNEAQKYARIVEYESSHQFSCLTKQNYADDYANLNLVYGESENTLRNINLMELVSNKWISQYINIDGMERLFSETYIEFEWEMHLSADYKKHNMKFYRDHFFHQVKDTYMMYMLLKNHGFYEYARDILMNESESKVSRFVCRSLVQQRYYESERVRELRLENADSEFYIRNLIYMASFMAGLFHDIGYPEGYYMTTSRHIRDYIASIHELNSEKSSMNRIYALLQNSLLFRVEPFEIIESRIKDSEKPDHGALSAIIFLLHFYENGAIYTLSPYKKAAVELAALAIYNHTNKYGIQGESKYTIYRPCFSLNPISYLLRICDDLQEWERIYFVISDKSNIVLCNKCKTPVIGFKEKNEKEIITRYRCNCQFLSGDGQSDKREEDRHIQAFDGRSKFSYRRIYNVSVCDSVVVEEDEKDQGKLLVKLHYDPYKLLHVAYLNATYAKYRISELNLLKALFECQKGIPKIYLDYFVTSNPVHIKVRMLEEYLEHQYTPDKNLKILGEKIKWKHPFIDNILQADLIKDVIEKGSLEDWIAQKSANIQHRFENLKRKFLKNMPAKTIGRINSGADRQGTYRNIMSRYIDISLELYSKLLLYQWMNEYLNDFKNESYIEKKQDDYKEYRDVLLVSEWEFAKQYFYTPELRCMIEDCFLQFTRMYLDIKDCNEFPSEYYEQYANGKREVIFQSSRNITDSTKYFNESEDYYYKALVSYLDAETYCPIVMHSKNGNLTGITDILDKKVVDAYTDLYLFYLINQELKEKST